jgi:hypothetical protein
MSKTFATLTIAAPLIIVPILAYRFNNWWLLIGVLISFLGAMLAASPAKRIFYLVAIFCIGVWLKSDLIYTNI